MRTSAKAEYACAAMLELAARRDSQSPVRIKDIADAHGISDRFLVQILLELKTNGLVASSRGKAGGYQLARDPEAITLAHIIEAMEDRTSPPTSKLHEMTRTPAVDVLLGVWKEAQRREQAYLEELTLADLLRRTQEGGAFSYQI